MLLRVEISWNTTFIIPLYLYVWVDKFPVKIFKRALITAIKYVGCGGTETSKTDVSSF